MIFGNSVIKFIGAFATTALLIMFSMVGVAKNKPLPKIDYACQVHTQAGVAGIVLVQAASLQLAEKVAGSVEAMTIGGEYSPSMSVIECIVEGEGSFKDSYFQSVYEEMDR